MATRHYYATGYTSKDQWVENLKEEYEKKKNMQNKASEQKPSQTQSKPSQKATSSHSSSQKSTSPNTTRNTVEEEVDYAKSQLNKLSSDERKSLDKVTSGNKMLNALQGLGAVNNRNNQFGFQTQFQSKAIEEKKKGEEEFKKKTGYDEKTYQKYVQYAREVSNYEDRKKQQEQIKKDTTEGNFITNKIARDTMDMADIIMSPFAGASAAAEGMLGKYAYADQNAPVDTNSANYMMQNYATDVEKARTDYLNEGNGAIGKVGKAFGKDLGKVDSFLYGTEMSMGKAALSMAIGGSVAEGLGLGAEAVNAAKAAGNFKKAQQIEKAASAVSNLVTLPQFGTSSYATTLQEAQDRGLSQDQAQATALVAGAAEMAFEKLSVDHFWDIYKNSGAKAARKAIVNVLAQSGIEGSEEVFTDIANAIADDIINKGKSENKLNYQKYIDNGDSESEAKKKAAIDFGKQIGQDFLGGAISGAVFGGFGVSANHHQNVQGANAEFGVVGEDGKVNYTGEQAAENYAQIRDSIPDVGNKNQSRIGSEAKQTADLLRIKAQNNIEITQDERTDLYQMEQYLNDQYAKDEKYRQAVQEYHKAKATQGVSQTLTDLNTVLDNPIQTVGSNEEQVTATLVELETPEKFKAKSDVNIEDAISNINNANNVEELANAYNEAKASARTPQDNGIIENLMNSRKQKMNVTNEDLENVMTLDKAYQTGVRNEELTTDDAFIREAYNEGKANRLAQNSPKTATAKANGKEFTIDKIKNVKGETYVTTNEGETVPLSVVSFANSEMSDIYEEASLSANPQAFIDGYTEVLAKREDASLQGFADTVEGVYNYARLHGTDGTFEKAIKNEAYAKMVPEATLKTFYDKGLSEFVPEKKIEKKPIPKAKKQITGETVDNAVMEAAKAFVKKANMDVKFEKKEGFNGQMDPYKNMILINPEADDLATTLTHEGFAELARHFNQDDMEKFSDAVIEWNLKNRPSEFNKEVKKYQRAYIKQGELTNNDDLKNKSYRQAANEVVNDQLVQILFADEEGIKSFAEFMAEKPKTLGQMVLDFIDSIIKNIKEIMGMNQKSYDLFKDDLESAKKLREQFYEIYSKALENKQALEVGEESSENVQAASVGVRNSAKTDEEIVSAAEKRFGTTNNFKYAGYIDTNGKLLDFSDGQKYRVMDHREISEVLDLPEDAGYSDGLIAFMNMGNIRMNEYGIDISVAPNKKQKSKLRDFFNSLDGEVTVDFSKENGDNIGSADYQEGTASSRILNDIDSYFETNEVPEGTVRYSVKVDSRGDDLAIGQQRFFNNTKAVDNDGDLQYVFHGTLSEFYEFKKDMANQEGNLGKGFYFTNVDYDAENNYADRNGPDFTNKVEREAELLEDDERYSDMDHDEIVEMLKDKYATDPMVLEGYLNIQNPVYINKEGKGDTYLFDFEDELPNYDDFEDEDEYYQEVEDIVGDKVYEALNAVRDYLGDDYYESEMETLSEIIGTAAMEGGITYEQLRSRLNDANAFFETEDGIAQSEVLRIIAESLGYDGIIDSSVSDKFTAMNMPSDTTHYVVFDSNQFKLADNKNPTDSPDIRYSVKVYDGNNFTPNKLDSFDVSNVEEGSVNLDELYIMETDIFKQISTKKTKDYISGLAFSYNHVALYRQTGDISAKIVDINEALGKAREVYNEDGRTNVDKWAKDYEILKSGDSWDPIIVEDEGSADTTNGLYGRNTNNGSSVDIQKDGRNSVKIETLDSDYEKAVEDGNEEEAKRLIQIAADRAYPETKGRYEDGTIREFYHGTNSDEFNEFDSKMIGTANDSGYFGRGFYFAFNKGEARMYGSNVIPAYLNTVNPYYISDLYKWNGKDVRDLEGDFNDIAFAMNFAREFPEYANDIEFAVYDENGNPIDYSFEQFEKDVNEIANNKKFVVSEKQGDYGTYYEVETDKQSENGYEWYDYSKAYADEASANDEILRAYHYLLETKYNDTFVTRPRTIIMDHPLSNTLQQRGYDSIYQSENGDEVVVFKSSQVGRSDITYDDNGNLIPPSKRFNPDNPDIRFSIKVEDKQFDDIKKRAKRYSMYDAWEELEDAGLVGNYNKVADDTMSQILDSVNNLFKGQEIGANSIKTVAKEIKEYTGSTINTATLEDELDMLFNHMQREDNQLNMDEMFDLFKVVARDVVKKMPSESVDDEFRSYVKSLKISLTDTQKEEVAHVYGSYNEFRQRNMGNLTITNDGMTLDELWNEIADQSNFGLSDNVSEAEQPLVLVDYLNALKEQPLNNYGASMDELATDTAIRILEKYYAAEQQALTNKALLDNPSAKKALEDARANMRKADQEFKKKVKEKYDAEVERLTKEREDAINSSQFFYKRTKDLESQLANTSSEADKEEIRKLKSQLDRKDKALIKAQAKAKAPLADYIYRQNRKKARDNVMRTANRLFKMVYEPTKQYHMPEALRKPVGEFLGGIDFISHRIKSPESATYVRWQEKMHRLKDALTKMADENTGDEYYKYLIDKDLLADMEEFLVNNSVKNKVSELDNAQLFKLDDIMKRIASLINKSNQAFANKQYATISEMANKTIDELSEKKERKYSNVVTEKLYDFLSISNLEPVSYFTEMGEAPAELFKELRSGENTRTAHLNESKQYMENLRKETGVDGKKTGEWRRTLHTFNLQDGSITMTTAQIMYLYKAEQRAQADNHINVSGIRPDVIKVNKMKKISQINGRQLTQSEKAEIIGTLTDEQKNFADKMQWFMANRCSDWGNHTTMEVYGYKKFTDPNYIPITTDPNTLAKNDKSENKNSFYGIINQGFTKNIQEGADNPLIVRDIFDVFTDHVTGMATYDGMTMPIMDAMRWFNYKQTIEYATEEGRKKRATSVQKSIERVMGVNGKGYFTKLMQDMNGMTPKGYDTGFIMRQMGKFKRVSVMANASVVAQQPMALIRATNEMNPKYIAEAQLEIPHAKKWADKAQKNSMLALWKSWGFFDTYLANSMEAIVTGEETLGEKMSEIATKGAQVADDLSWGILYRAVELEIMDKHPDLKYDSKEFTNAVVERYEEICDKTQVVDSILHRSQIMRSTDTGVKAGTTFMSEPTKSYNMLHRSVIQVVNGGSDKDKKQLLRTMVVFILNAIGTAAASSLVYALRDDDDETNFGDRYMVELMENSLDNLNPLKMLPYGSNLVSILKGYDSQNLTYQGIEMALDSAKNTLKYLNGSGSKTLYGVIKKDVQALSLVTGIPAYNLLREFETVYNAFNENLQTSTSNKEYSNVYKDVYNAIKEGENPLEAITKYYGSKVGVNDYTKMVKAIKKGDSETYLNEINALLEDHDKSEIRGKITKEFKPIYLEMEDSTEKAKFKETLLKAYSAAGYDRETMIKAIDKW